VPPVLRLRVIRQASLLIFGVALRKRGDCEAAAEEGRGENYVAFKGAYELLLALVNRAEFLDDCVDIIQGVLNFVVGVSWRQFQLQD